MKLHTKTPFAQAVMTMLKRIADTFPETLDAPVRVHVAGGAATHFYTANRVSEDLDVEFWGRRVLVPQDLLVSYQDEAGQVRSVIFDINYNPTFALMQEDYPDRVVFLGNPFGDPRMEVFLLAPLDLAISKVARLSDNDRVDIAALAKEGLIESEALKQHAEEALSYYVGAKSQVAHNISQVYKMIQDIEKDRPLQGNASDESKHPSP